MKDKTEKNQFQETLNLPRTDFSLRARAQEKEPELLKRWQKENINRKVTEKNYGAKKFILHFGPPYANGHLHIGHALTETLKDIVCKAKRMVGFHTPLVPGWDCHGLPIELKAIATSALREKFVEQASGPFVPSLSRDRPVYASTSSARTGYCENERVALKKQCREYAQQWIDVQMQELQEQAIFADYDNAYSTMDPKYEALTLDAFATFVERGHIERKLKTVPWCGSCQTVLATAEIEYKERKDPSVYVLFPLSQSATSHIFPSLYVARSQLVCNFVLWTTTPWSIPLNRGVGLNPAATYVVLQGRHENQGLIVAKNLADDLCVKMALEKILLAEVDSSVFVGTHAQHPLVKDLHVPVFLDNAVLTSEGTACFSCAPGCGPEDYMLAVKHALEVYSPLSSDGKYTKGILPMELEGMRVEDGQQWVIDTLASMGQLAYQTSITHAYPHCWRCHRGLMFRATRQWFCNLTKNDLLQRSLREIDQTKFIPERGKARFASFITNRNEWCISRQRQWGNPIPALLCCNCDWTFLDAHFIRGVVQRVAQEGIEFWDRMTMQMLVEQGLLPADFNCEQCSNADLAHFALERDILDVWFDSGVSNYAVLAQDPATLGVPADMYLEGSDQHRGWFQSSWLCSMVIFNHAPMKTIVTHGFVVDEHKRKMSKSIGNVVAPQQVINTFSRDVLRLWVATVDYENDSVISDNILKGVAEMYRKMRNTCRFMLANVYDFDIACDAVAIEQMLALDQYALAQLYELTLTVRQSYDQYHIANAMHAINAYCTNNLSATYLDILKDRLYTEQADSHERRSAQTALYYILDALSRLMAPVLSFLAEEVSDFYQKNKQESIHVQDFPVSYDVWSQIAAVRTQSLSDNGDATRYSGRKKSEWHMLELVRLAVFKMLEEKRVAGEIKHSYEAQVSIFMDPTSKEYALFTSFMQETGLHEDSNRFLKDWLLVSAVTIASSCDGLRESTMPGVYIGVQVAQGTKCPRCWQWSKTMQCDGLCARCEVVVQAIK